MRRRSCAALMMAMDASPANVNSLRKHSVQRHPTTGESSRGAFSA